VVPDLDKTVKSFIGCEKQQEARDWLDTIIGLTSLNGWSDVFKLLCVRSNVVGAGRNWFLSGNFKSWNELVEDFELMFTQFDSKVDIWDAIKSRVQGRNEHVSDYFYDKYRPFTLLKLDFNEIKNQIIQGLHSKELSVYLLSKV